MRGCLQKASLRPGTVGAITSRIFAPVRPCIIDRTARAHAPPVAPKSVNQKPPVASNTISFGLQDRCRVGVCVERLNAPVARSTAWIDPGGVSTGASCGIRSHRSRSPRSRHCCRCSSARPRRSRHRWATADLGDACDTAVGRNAAEPPAKCLDDKHAAIRIGDRPFREREPAYESLHLRPLSLRKRHWAVSSREHRLGSSLANPSSGRHRGSTARARLLPSSRFQKTKARDPAPPHSSGMLSGFASPAALSWNWDLCGKIMLQKSETC